MKRAPFGGAVPSLLSPPSVFSADDLRYMKLALRLAARAEGRTSPNPMVGTVIVKDGRVLATGYHHRAGLAHAEVDALGKVAGRAAGATLYVNLEPCNHRGRTPPCTDALLASGLARVVIGMIDPNPLVNGQGSDRLRKAGMVVDVGCLGDEARRLNAGFISVIERGRPFVTLKLAATADGHTATRTGHSRWITGEASRKLVHAWRARADAVLIGVGTALKDEPALTVRDVRGRDPLRVVVDSHARLSPRARLLREGTSPVLVAVTRAAPAKKVAALQGAGAEVLMIPARGRRVVLEKLLRELARRGVNHVLCEGGATLAGALVVAGLVDKLALFYAPKLLVGGAPLLAGAGVRTMDAALALQGTTVRRVGEDFLLEAYL